MNASANTSDTVLARARVREVTGVFHSRAALDVAAGELLLMGFDRADVDVSWRASTRFERGSAPPMLPPRNWLTCRKRLGGPSSPAKMCQLSTRSLPVSLALLLPWPRRTSCLRVERAVGRLLSPLRL
jgi:hypothetical protein